MLFTAQLIVFFISAWLGMYLISRNFNKESLIWAGLGLISFAFAIVIEAIVPYTEAFSWLNILQKGAIYIPPVFWTGEILSIHISPSEHRYNYLRAWKYFGAFATLIIVGLYSFSILPIFIVQLASLIPLTLAFTLFIFSLTKSKTKPPIGLLLVGTIFFTISLGVFLPSSLISKSWVITLIGLDIVLMGIGIAVLDAFDEGHQLKKDMKDSLISTTAIGILFSGQVAIVIYFSPAINEFLVLLLFSSLFSAVFVQSIPVMAISSMFNKNDEVKKNIKKFQVLSHKSKMILKDEIDFYNMPNDEFERYTRRAISYINDLAKLSTSPLIKHPLVEKYLQESENQEDTLSRTHALKVLLSKFIFRLKPQIEDSSGTTDDWKYFNVLYYPYIAGIKPNKKLLFQDGISPEDKKVIEWFVDQVPDRTLYNWQNIASKMIAQHFQDMLEKLPNNY
jgi:hypothetical protein